VRSGVERALAEQEGLAKGVNPRAGRIAYPAVGAALGFFE
jgi:alanine dehydrogenase